MKRATTKIAPKKPRRPWRKKVVALLEKWANDNRKLTLINAVGSYSVHYSGTLVRLTEGFFSFRNDFGLCVYLRVDDWNTVEFEDIFGTTLRVNGETRTGFAIREDGQDPVKISTEVRDQLALWVMQRTVLLVLFRRGFHVFTALFRAHEASEEIFILLDEKTLELHVFELRKCLGIVLKVEKSFRSISLQDAGQVVEIGEYGATPEDVLKRFTNPANLIN